MSPRQKMVSDVHSWTIQGRFLWARPYACVARVSGPSRIQKGTSAVGGGTVFCTGMGCSGLLDCQRRCRGRKRDWACRRNATRYMSVPGIVESSFVGSLFQAGALRVKRRCREALKTARRANCDSSQQLATGRYRGSDFRPGLGGPLNRTPLATSAKQFARGCRAEAARIDLLEQYYESLRLNIPLNGY